MKIIELLLYYIPSCAIYWKHFYVSVIIYAVFWHYFGNMNEEPKMLCCTVLELIFSTLNLNYVTIHTYTLLPIEFLEPIYLDLITKLFHLK